MTAVLGPTNTGKTHLAIERMLGHETGIIGLPLRLLAREVYARVAARAGESQVALVTGEEKIVPPEPRYWVSTVEAMPRQTDAAFVAIDEVQIAADLERGHVFTDRILNLRGSQETLLLGAATMRGIIEQLLPGVHVVTRPRMSVLTYSGQKKLTRLPERSAVVTFSADEVYAVAELIRRQRGGAAVVLGALSPRTRNKQVELYQSGDVDFLVATDAIGMGLNLDLDHVAFAATSKYDGYQFRDLSAAEFGQIAGRAGRHMRDGTFGVTGRVTPLPDPLVEAIETHRFEPVKTLQWRSDDLDFSSIAALKASLEKPANVPGLTKAPPADDQTALEAVARDRDLADRADNPEAVRRLWDVCRLPDYRRIAPAQHAQLVGDLFGFIADGGVVPTDWIARQVEQANRTDGDIDTLSSRIAHIRTWTFVANQPDWLAEPVHWREETKAVEDALSDALHDRLTKRFVDRRTSVLMRRLRENTMLEAEITPAGDVLVEGQHVGMLQGFRFTPDQQAEGAEAKALRAAAQKALATAITDRAERLARCGDADLVLSLDGYIRWQGEPVARLVAADDALKPRFVLLADEQLTGPARDMVDSRLAAWIAAHVANVLKPLIDLRDDEALSGMARGIAFRLAENFGIVDRRDIAEEVRGLDQDARASLRRHGVRFGAHHIYVPALLKPGPSTFLAQLWALKNKDLDVPGLGEVSGISGSGRTSVAVDPSFDPEVYRRFGFRLYGRRAVRIDILERLADLIRPALSWNGGSGAEPPAGAVQGGRGFVVTPAMTSLLGASGEDFAAVLKGLGYRMERLPREAATPQRPAPAPEAAAPAAADAAPTEATGAEAAAPAEALEASEPGQPTIPTPDAPPPGVPGAPIPVPGEPGPGEPGPAPVPDEEPPVEQPPVEEPPAQDPDIEPPVEPSIPPGEEPGPAPTPIEEPPMVEPPVQEPPAEIPLGAESPADGAAIATDAEAAVAGAAEAELDFVEVWRAGGGGQRRGGRDQRNRRAQGPAQGAARDARRGESQGGAARAGDAERPEGRRGEERQDRPERQGRPGRPQRHGKPRFDKGERGAAPGGAGSGGQRNARPEQRPQRDRPIDPDSPFAKLAALKANLEKNNSG